MIRKPQYKVVRRLGEKIYPKTQTAKFAVRLASRGIPVRKHGGHGRSEYALQLLEKQKARAVYGVGERQFRAMVERAQSARGSAAERLFKMLEMRLDSVVAHLRFAATNAGARQFISHGHVVVNGRRVTIPSYQVKVGDIVSVREQSRMHGILRDYTEKVKGYSAPDWLSLSVDKLSAEVKGSPRYDGSVMPYDLRSVLEFYSRA